MNHKFLIFLATSTLATAAIAGTALATDSQQPSPPPAGSPAVASAGADPTSAATHGASPTVESTTAAPVGAAPTAGRTTSIGPDRAGEIALARVGGGTVGEIEREMEHGRLVWKVRIYQDGVRYRVRVDAQTGQVVRADGDGDGDGIDDRGQGSEDPAGDDHGGDDYGRDDR